MKKQKVVKINTELPDRQGNELNFFTGRSVVLQFQYPHTFTGTVLATVGVHPRRIMVDMLILVMGQVVHIETDRLGKAKILTRTHLFPAQECDIKIQ